MTTDARQVERLRAVAESRLHADRPPYTRLVPVGAHVLIELLDAAEAHAALVKAVEGLADDLDSLAAAQREKRPQSGRWVGRAVAYGASATRVRNLLAATNTAADRGAR